MDDEFDARMGDMDLDWLYFRDAEERDWDESKHPRDDHGRFGAGGGGSDTDESDDSRTADQHGLTTNDRTAVHSWLGDGYRELRTSPEFGKTLEKLPKFSGRVYRGSRLKASDLSKLKVGSTYKIEKFSSSSVRMDVATDFTDPNRHDPSKGERVIFAINDSGRKIPRVYMQLAGSDEEEVILMRGDRYKVDEMVKEFDGAGHPYTRVSMSQVHDK